LVADVALWFGQGSGESPWRFADDCL
jgi:hypothetical protein